MSDSGFTDDDGVTRIPTSALTDDALCAYTLLVLGVVGLVVMVNGKAAHGPDGAPIPTQEAAEFGLRWFSTYRRPWANDGQTRLLWVTQYKRGAEELAALGVVEGPLFDVMGQPVVSEYGFPLARVFHRDRVYPGQFDLKEGPSS